MNILWGMYQNSALPASADGTLFTCDPESPNIKAKHQAQMITLLKLSAKKFKMAFHNYTQ